MRLLFLLVVGGAVLIFIGYQEFTVSHGASADPVAVDLSKLEAGDPLPNSHVEIGEHTALYSDHVYSFSKPKGSNAPPTPDTKVTYVFYPLLSRNHPYWAQLDEFIRQHGAQALQNNPGPPVGKIAVIVKSYRFPNVGSIPQQAKQESKVKGLVINRISSLSNEEEKLIAQGFPGTNFKEVLILEENRAPASAFKWLGLMGGGVALILLAAGIFFAQRK